VTDLLVTGASGYLAHRLIPLACQRGEVVVLSRSEPDAATRANARWVGADLLEESTVDVIIGLRPRAIINAAATNPGSGHSFATNVMGAAHVARAASRTGSRLVHVSSDIVHSGQAAPYGDDAEPDPVNDYGRSKADGEASILAAVPEAVVVRTSLIYSLERMDRGTAGFADRLRAGESLSLWADAIRQPVYADALSEALLILALDAVGERGTINVAGEQALSRAEFGRRLLAHWGVDTSRITEGTALDVAGQPLDLAMRFDRARSLGLPIPGVADVLG
jgi:dTDP-4-dehydrorhamnose reductase